jgi:3-phosphoshikimate 1-carboxyvinyltransferase
MSSDVLSLLSFKVDPGGRLSGTHRVPGDKSISHRAVMFAALAEGTSTITGFLDGEDCLCTLRAFESMGARVERLDRTSLRITGVGINGLKAPGAVLDVGNSGTSMRLMCGLLAAQPFATTLTGDASLRRRPMKRVTDPLARMGAVISTQPGGRAPLEIQPAAQSLTAIRHDSPVASAQVKSSILLAGLYADGLTEVHEPEASRDHTERMLTAFGVVVEAREGYAAVQGGQRLHATDIEVPSDISSAAFLMVGAAISSGSDVTLEAVGLNPTRTGVIHILKAMGARITIGNERTIGGEPVGDVRIRGSVLRGIDIKPAWVASAIDEFPAIFVAAACAQGETRLSGAAELRVKESDRIAAMCNGLRALGIDAIALADGARITGGRLHGGQVESLGDHRIAMSFAIAALRAEQPITIRDCDNVATSFPGFSTLMQAAGLRLRVITRHG